MHGRLVAPVWHNREVHRDFECWSLRKRTIYDPGNYVDVGGHGALILPGSFQLQPTRKYVYHVAASGCPCCVNAREPPCHVAVVDFDPEHRKILVGNSEGVVCRNPESLESERISSEGATSIKVQDFRSDSVVVAVASSTSLTTFRNTKVLAKHELRESIDCFDLSPFIQSEFVTCVRNSVTLSDLTVTLKSNLLVEDVSFFTNPRHLALAQTDSVLHCDVRSPSSISKIVDNKCLNILPKNCFSSVKVNCRNVNQLFVLSNDCLSLWDVRYSIQPMGVFNHYVSRSAQLLGMQVLPMEDSLFVLVRSNTRSTLFEFDPTFSSPSAALLGPQLQFSSPADIGLYYWDQTGDQVSDGVWKRLSQPTAGSCIVPSRENKDELVLNSFTITGDWFCQKLQRKGGRDDENPPPCERTFVYGMDAFSLNEDQLQEVKNEIEKLKTHCPARVLPEVDTSIALGANTVMMEGISLSRWKCSVCTGESASQIEGNRCENCGLGDAADMLNDAWLGGGLIRKSEGLTEEEENRSRELLGQTAAGLAVSDAVRAVWGEVDWRVVGETGTGATTGDANDQADPEENLDGYEDD